MKPFRTASISLAVLGVVLGARATATEPAYSPAHYVCYRTPGPLVMDGKLDEPAWARATWTGPFVDIQGEGRPAPRLRSRAKMLWDDTYFYVAAQLEEPHLWATLTERDAVIYHDNDFEVFIDPDGDTHAYYEIEINALGTVWDLMLLRPYRDGGPAIDAWDIRGLGVGIHLDGTLNDPTDTDRAWSVELAIPWAALEEAAPEARAPRAGEQWRVNFSRVQWQLTANSRSYAKVLDPDTGKPLPEDNWVWSPQGTINMHRPEHWGFVQFSGNVVGTMPDAFRRDPDDAVRWALRQLYYRQREYREEHGRYANDLAALAAEEVTVPGIDFLPRLTITPRGYAIATPGAAGQLIQINASGRVWSE